MLLQGLIFPLIFCLNSVVGDLQNNPFLTNVPATILDILNAHVSTSSKAPPVTSPPVTSPPLIDPHLSGQPSSPTVGPVVTTNPPINVNKSCLKPRGQFPGSACNKFINCWDGVAVEQDCPGGLLFNPKGFCDYPSGVDCNGKPIVTDSPPPPTNTPASSTEKPLPPWNSETKPTTPVGIITTPAIITLPTSAPDPYLKKRCLKPRGQFPSASCNKYVNCWDDTVIEQDCPEGLLFSDKGYCDYAINVKCGDRNVTQKISELEMPTDCPLDHGTFRNKTKCNSYYTCIGYKVVASYDCPEGFNFNDNLGVCDFEHRVDCSKDPLIFETRDSQSSSQQNQVQPNKQECPDEFGLFRDKANCSIYYNCAYYQIASTFVCPEGFSFNDNIGVCDYSERVDCSKPVAIFKHRNLIAPPIPPAYLQRINSCQPGEVFPLNPSCNLACRCGEDRAEIIQCPSGLAYDSSLNKCILSNLARC